MKTNELILLFVKNNTILLVLLVLLLFLLPLRIIPPEWAGFWKYNNNNKDDGEAPKITVLQFFLNNVFDGTLRSFFIPVLVAFNLKNTVTLILLLVVLFDIFFQHQISGAAVTLVGIGILTLYLDRLIETGKHIKLFGLLSWDKDEKQPSTTFPSGPTVSATISNKKTQ